MTSCKKLFNHKINSSSPWFSLKISSLLILLFALFSSSVCAKHALSGIRSDTEAPQFKYMPDHHDLISTEGGELSLAHYKFRHAYPSPSSSSKSLGPDKPSDLQARQHDYAAGGITDSHVSRSCHESSIQSNQAVQGTVLRGLQAGREPAAIHSSASTTGRKFSESAARFRLLAPALDTTSQAPLTSGLRSALNELRDESALVKNDVDHSDRSSSEGAKRRVEPLGQGPNSDSTTSEETSNVIENDQIVNQVVLNVDGSELTKSVRREIRPNEASNRQGMMFERKVGSVNGQSSRDLKQKQTYSNVPEPATLGHSGSSEKEQLAKDEILQLPAMTNSKVSVDESEDAASYNDDLVPAVKQQRQIINSALAYFRQVSSDQTSRLPDSARDESILSNHFPGSLAHLTRAASELELSGAATGKLQPEQQAASLAIANASIASLRAQVTPEPESQPESQQIMAPVLMSTTTMAPMTATSG